MSHFDRKSLIFYGVAISSVVALFSTVTRYGNAHLHPPVAIEGNYPLQIQPSASCPEPPALQLHLQQSGIFMNGSLIAASPEALSTGTANTPLTLDGRWHPPKLEMTGQLQKMQVCGQAVTQVAIAGTHDGNTLSGELTFVGLPNPLAFESQVISTPAPEKPASH